MRTLKQVNTNTLHQVAPWILGGLICWLSWQIASVFWLLVAPSKAPIMQLTVPNTNGSQVPSLASMALFKEKSNASPVDTSQPDIEMKLEGVFVGTSGKSSAIINAAGKSKQYQVGNKIEGSQSTLAQVGWDYIILRRGGGMENASLFKLKFGETSAVPLFSPNQSQNPNIPNNMPPMVGVAPQMPSDFSGQMGNRMFGRQANTNNQADAMLNNAINRFKTDPNGYLHELGVKATANGYELDASAPKNMTSQLGLRPGDVVTAVNGIPIGNVQQDVGLLQRVQTERSAQITVQRGQQTVTIQQTF